jgi:hypothetical protein
MIPEEEVIDQGQDQATDQGAKSQEQAQAEQLILGKFKTHEDLERGYKELESMAGRQSSDVGDLRKQNELLTKQLELVHQQFGEDGKGSQGKQETKEPSFDDRLAEISQQVEDGDIDIAQALKLTSEITAQKALQMQRESIQQQEHQKTIQTYQDKFLQENPDFYSRSGSKTPGCTPTTSQPTRPSRSSTSRSRSRRPRRRAISKAEAMSPSSRKALKQHERSSPNPARTSGKQATAASPSPTRKCGRACWQDSDSKGKH